MAADQDQRPRFHEDQYLGAEDLDQTVEYARTQLARHSLGGHTWGISIGLDLVEKPWPGSNRVDVYVTPGYAWDGFGRPVVVLALFKMQESLFAEIKYDANNSDDKDGKGRLVRVWLRYDESTLRPPASGFGTCEGSDQNSRIQETFGIVVGDRAKDEQRGSVTINGSPADPSQPPYLPSNLYDESVPYQEFRTTQDSTLWLIPIGYVRWLPTKEGSGYLVKRDDTGPTQQNPLKEPDSDLIRRSRQYAGVVTEAVEGAGGVIRLRDRFKDPDPKVSHFRPPRIPTDQDKSPENDLVWVEGSLRVQEGDTRLAGGKLAFRAVDGTDKGTPLEIRRFGDSTANTGKRTLQVILGPSTQPDNKLAVGCLVQPAGTVDQKFVVSTSGKVGIGVNDPVSALQVNGNTTSQSLNVGGANNSGDPGPGNVWITGSTGIGTSAPLGRVDIDESGSQPNSRLKFGHTAPGFAHHITSFRDLVLNSSDGIYIRHNPTLGDPTTIKELVRVTPEGNVGIGTKSPGAKLDVAGSLRLNGGTPFSKIQAGTSVVGHTTGTAKSKNVTVTFSDPFNGTPRVLAMARGGNYPDTFALTTTAINSTSFSINVRRVDANSGWAQNLQLDWFAWE